MPLSKSKKRWMNNSTRIILVAILALAILRILLHYTEYGFFEFILFDLIPKWWVFILPLFVLLYRYKKKRLTYKTTIIDFVVTAIGFYIIYFVATPKKLDDLDWKMNYEKRQKIVSLAKKRKLNSITDRIYAIPDSLTLFPFFKPNEVIIEKQKDSFVTMLFYTDRGLLDHYSGFIYSNDSIELKVLEENVKNGGNDVRLENNWYQIHD